MAQIVVLAIALVVGRAQVPYRAVAHRGTVACTTKHADKADALRAGERLEPRIAPAPPADGAARLPVAALGPFAIPALASSPCQTSNAPHSDHRRLVVLQRIPRLESGDPPRV